ncbi:hypothetical protein ACWDTT_10520 [Streptosporangium sandarakinum]
MATYPGGFRIFTTKRDFTQTIFESHINDIQGELEATQKVLGINPHIALNDPCCIDSGDDGHGHGHGHTTDRHYQNHGTVGQRIQNYMRGEQLPYYAGSVTNYPLKPGPKLGSVPADHHQVPLPPQSGSDNCASWPDGMHWTVPIHSHTHISTPPSAYVRMGADGLLIPLTTLAADDGHDHDHDHSAAAAAPGEYVPLRRTSWTTRDDSDDRRGRTCTWQAGDDFIPGDHFIGLPCVHDSKTTDDGRWWRLPIAPDDDPCMMKSGDGFILAETGLWTFTLRVDGLPTTQTGAAKAIRQARLEIDGKDVLLRHRLAEGGQGPDAIVNYVTWTEILPAGTIITASARVDGAGITGTIPVNAYLRGALIRCIDNPNPYGGLADVPPAHYNPPPPPPPPPPPAPSPVQPPTSPGGYDDCAYYLRGGANITVGSYNYSGTVVAGQTSTVVNTYDTNIMRH